MQKKTVVKITSVLLMASVLLTLPVAGARPTRARVSARNPGFWLLAIEHLREGDARDGQRLISGLLQYPNWNNSTGYTSHVHLLSQYPSDEVLDDVRPCLVGYPYFSVIQREIVDFLGQAAPGDVVVLYAECHGDNYGLFSIGVEYSVLNDWLCSGNLPLCYVTVIIDSCNCGNSIWDGRGGILGPNRNVLCGCMSSEVVWYLGHPEGGHVLAFSHCVTEGFSMCEDRDGDGWVSTKEVFSYAGPVTTQVVWDVCGVVETPVSYYGQVDGNVPLVQRDAASVMPDLPPLIVGLSPQNATYTKAYVPLVFAASESLSWAGYSLDDAPAVTLVGNAFLVGLSEGSHSVVFYGTDVSGNMGNSLKTFFSVRNVVVPMIADIGQDVMKLTSIGKLLLVCIEPSTDFSLSDVDVSTIRLNGTVPTQSVTLEDCDGDGVPELVMIFNRTLVSELVVSEHVMYGEVTLTVNALLHDGTFLEGSDTINVRMPGDTNIDGKVDVRDITLVGKAFGCCAGQARWCSAADENEDGKIDIRDIALIAKQFGKNYQ